MSNKLRAIRPLKRTKIVATLGPSSEKEETLRRMVLAGLDAIRVNFSHSSHNYLIPLVKRIRKLGDKMGVPIAIIGDLQGPRIRIGEIVQDSAVLKSGREICLTPRQLVGNKEIVSVSYPGMANDVNMGSLILVDDGNIELEVIKIDAGGDVWCRILKGGVLSGHRGINLP